jgi:hypothetical protein
LRKAFDFECVETAVRAKAKHPAQYGGAGQTLLARFRDDPFMQQLAIMTVALSDENA